MKRIMKMLLLIILVSMIKIGVKAESFYEDNYLNNIYVTYKNSTVYKPQQMRYIRRTSDNSPVYCLTPSRLLYYDENYSVNNNYNISSSKLKRIQQISYFGYGYKNHNSDKWYAITQFMIWKEMDNNYITFTDTYDGNSIVRFSEEENEINRLINNYNRQIPLSDMKIKYNDSPSVLNEGIKDYNIYSELEIIRPNDNSESFIINGNKIGDFKVSLVNKDGDYPTPTTIYTASRGQDVMIRGSIEKTVHSFNINVSLGTLVIGKFPSDWIFDLPVEGAEYSIYDLNDSLVATAIIGEDGYSYTELKHGDYYVLETKSPDGYELDLEKHYVTVNDEYIYLDLTDDKTEVDINIHKKLENNQNESDIKFDIYDSNNNIVKSVSTDINGNTNTKLTYGIYKIKQVNTTKYYNFIDDIDIKIDKKDSINLELTNRLIDSRLRINKLDKDTNKLIIHPTEFVIKDMINDKYIGNYTTLNGIIDIDIKAGLYRLYEVSEPFGYSRMEPIDFEVLDSNPVILDVYNTKDLSIESIVETKKIIEEPVVEKIKQDTLEKQKEINSVEEIKTIYPKTSHIEESIVVSIIYVLFVAGMYLYAKHKEK